MSSSRDKLDTLDDGARLLPSMNTAAAARRLGVSRNTLLRWFRERRISEPARDFRGWRRFTEEDLERIRGELRQNAHPVPDEAPPAKPDAVVWSSRMEFLRQVPLFSSLSNSDLAALDAVAVFRGYARGSTLFHEGQMVLGLHVLLKGRIKLLKLSSEGRQQILEIVGPVSTFAETPLFDRTGVYPMLGRASVVSSVLTIPREPLRALMAARPNLNFAFLGAFAERMKELMRKLEEATFLTVDERLARYVLKRAEDGIVAELNVAEVAALIGAARESVSRALGRWTKAEIITIKSGRLVVLDAGRLELLA